MAEKYRVKRAYLFLGYIPEKQDLYLSLQKAGFCLVFKPVSVGLDGRVKGNCDAELVLQAMIDYREYDQAVIVSGDGDFYCLVNYFYVKNKLKVVLAPNKQKYSGLLKKAAREKLEFFNKLEETLRYEKAPHKDETM